MKRPKKALLILEQPWWDMDENPNRASVYPFFHGLEKLMDDVKVYHTTFYERSSFEAALNDLAEAGFERLFLYVAAHGLGKRLAGMNLSTVMKKINTVANDANIEGLILGSCDVGSHVEAIQQGMARCNIVWTFGYTGETEWLPSTLIDMNVLHHAMRLRNGDLSDRDRIFSAFADALALFNGSNTIGWDSEENEVALKDAVSLVIQPRGQGFKPILHDRDVLELFDVACSQSSFT